MKDNLADKWDSPLNEDYYGWVFVYNGKDVFIAFKNKIDGAIIFSDVDTSGFDDNAVNYLSVLATQRIPAPAPPEYISIDAVRDLLKLVHPAALRSTGWR